MESTFFSLKTRDFLKGLAIAVIAPVIQIIVASTSAGSLVFDWKAMLTVAISAAGAYLLKNLLTDDTKLAEKIADEQGQKIVPKSSRVLDSSGRIINLLVVMIGLSVFFCGTASAQKGFLGPISIKQPTVNVKVTNGKSITFQNVKVTKADSTFNAIRPAVSIGTIFAGGTAKVVAGTGIEFQRITYTYAKGNPGDAEYVPGRAYVNFAVGLHVLAGVSVNEDIPTKIPSVALLFSALNGQVSAGPAYGDMRDVSTGKTEGKFGLMLNWKINFNN